ncbi:hypothetical protein RUM43_012636 [Polyplax serrata]|uniref:Uncharacterized protein n=1 Tax=Polyplax serrata TaxID=468196 RepID=A0AAN8S9P4_POLSC
MPTQIGMLSRNRKEVEGTKEKVTRRSGKIKQKKSEKKVYGNKRKAKVKFLKGSRYDQVAGRRGRRTNDNKTWKKKKRTAAPKETPCGWVVLRGFHVL